MTIAKIHAAISVFAVLLLGCGDGKHSDRDNTIEGTDDTPSAPLIINEVMTKNDGAWVDRVGETDDWLELYNPGPVDIALAGWTVADSADTPFTLESGVVPAGGHLVLFADDDVDQGPEHLPFKLSSDGDRLTLRAPTGQVVDEMTLPPLAPNVSFVRSPDGTDRLLPCRFATPGRANGEQCGPPPPPSVPDDVTFSPFEWSESWPPLPTPLTVNELRLFDDGFVELINVSDETLQLADFELRIAPIAAGQPYPGPDEGDVIPLPQVAVSPDERIFVPIENGEEVAVAETPRQEGVLSIFDKHDGRPIERIDFMHWPEGAALTRQPDRTGYRIFCNDSTPGSTNDRCDPVPSREVESHIRHIRTPGDFEALAAGDLGVGLRSVKCVVDLEANEQSYFLKSSRWLLHYNFVRDIIEGNDPLDLCDPEQKAIFQEGRDQFDAVNYYQVEGRRYLLGTLSHHAGSGLHTFEYNSMKDVISGDQMKRGFFSAMRRVPHPQEWYLRPVLSQQVQQAQAVDGELPIVSINGPFQNVTFQPLNPTVGFGVLTFLPAEALDDAPLGPQVLLLTDLVPNDIPLAAGVITESYQTPLSHVNVLSKNRGTPNMSLVDARNHPEVTPLIGKLARLEVTATDFAIREATPEEAAAFQEERLSGIPLQVPNLDDTITGLVPLSEAGFEDTPAIGAKAAQLAELVNMAIDCDVPLVTPTEPFAIPVSYYLRHFADSGAGTLLSAFLDDAEFQTNPIVRDEGLAAVREAILLHPVASELIDAVEARMLESYGTARVRFRSSSNTEDLVGFSGAGLYTSLSAAVEDPDRTAEDAIRTVWAGLWNSRAYEERAYYNVSQEHVAMAILCHEAFLSERANGVAISRDLTNPKYGARDTVNVQFGEASVTNPAPGISADLFGYRSWRDPSEDYFAVSTFMNGEPVLKDEEIDNLHCTLRQIHAHLRPFIDPDREDNLFTIDIEFKLISDERTLMVKQARPYTFGHIELDDDC